MKLVNPIQRREGMSRVAFKDYYENHHAPLGTQYFPFEKYVRNHLVESAPAEVGFDCLMECWLDHTKAMDILTGDIEKLFADDEAKLMRRRALGVPTEEILAAGSPRGLDSTEVWKETLLLRKPEGESSEAFAERLRAWGNEVGARAGGDLIRIVVDRVVAVNYAELNADALVTAWLRRKGALLAATPLPPGATCVGTVTTVPHETTPAQLAAAFGSWRKKGA
jgi:hypothetical protein